MFKRFKRAICQLLVLAMLLSYLPQTVLFTVSAASVDGDYEYTTSNGEATITGYSGSATEITIPSAVDGYPVTAIGDSAFNTQQQLTSVVIPTGVVSIGAESFRYCKGLKTVSLPDGLTAIGNNAFLACVALSEITIPNSVTVIGIQAFHGCTALISVTLPGSVVEAGNAVFSACDKLQYVDYPGTMEQCVGKLNQWIDSLPIRCTDGVIEAFGKGGDNVWTLDGRGVMTITGTGKLADNLAPPDMWDVDFWPWYPEKITQLILGEGITEISWGAFCGQENMTSVYIPSSVETIGERVFYYCSNLTDVYYAGTEQQWQQIPIGDYNDELLNATVHYSCDTPEDSEGTTSFTYELVDGQATITGHTGSNADITIPSELDGYPVTAIGEYAFENAYVTTLTIPNCVETIGEYAFSGCVTLANLNIENNMVMVANTAFNGCNFLRDVYYCGTQGEWGNLVNGCIEELYDVNVRFGDPGTTWTLSDDGVLEITGIGTMDRPRCIMQDPADSPWSWDSRIKRVIINEGLTNIVSGAFCGCEAMIEVTIPLGITEIKAGAFEICTALKDVYFGGTEQQWQQIPIGDYNEDLLNATIHFMDDEQENPEGTMNFTYELVDGQATITGYTGFNADITIPSELDGYPVTVIGDHLFENTRITSVQIPNSVKRIGVQAFAGCFDLKTVVIPGSVTVIDDCAFGGSGLTSVVISEGVVAIGDEAFQCTELKTIVLPSTVASIACHSFTGLEIERITILNSLINIQELAFGYSNRIHEIYYSGTKEQWDFVSRNIKNDNLTIGMVYFGDPGTTWTLSDDGVLEITGSGPMDREGAVMQDPADSSWSYNSQIKRVIINEGLTSIAICSFYYCEGMTEVTIPVSVTEIKQDAFYECTALKDVYYAGTRAQWENVIIRSGNEPLLSATIHFSDEESAPPVIERVVVDSQPTKRIYLKGQSLDLSGLRLKVVYSDSSIEFVTEGFATSGFNPNQLGKQTISVLYDKYDIRFTVYVIESAGSCGENLSWTLNENGLLTIFGKGDMYNYENAERTPWYAFSEVIKTVVIQEGATTIGDYAFDKCSNITAVTVPASLTEVGDCAFRVCNKLTSFAIGNAVTKIGVSAFENCTSLQGIAIPAGLTEIGDFAFRFCMNITGFQVDLANPVYSNDEYGVLFSKDKTVLIQIPGNMSGHYEIPEGVVMISSYAFALGKNLTSVDIPDTVKIIGANAFFGCGALKDMEIPFGTTIIPGGSFSACDKLVIIKIPETVTKIESNAFVGCDKLESVIIPRSVVSMSVDSFPPHTLLLVYENSYAHIFARENNLKYRVIRETENPDVTYGTNLSGTVSYDDGTPASAVAVKIFYDDGVLKEETVTDAVGSYTFDYVEVGTYTIRATDSAGKSSAAQINIKLQNETEVFVSGNRNLVLKKSYSISGRLSQDAATVLLSNTVGRVQTSLTVTNGTFCFANVTNGTYIVKATTKYGSVYEEVTVFNGNVADLYLEIPVSGSQIWGYVQVENRDKTLRVGNWAQVTVYNTSGVAVDQGRTNAEGKYAFIGLPVGQYAVVAEISEMRPDKTDGFSRNHKLTGCVFTEITEDGQYQLDTLVLREKAEGKVSLSGKVTANGETQDCEVVVQDAFRDEVARYKTPKNGKFCFVNLCDGLYIITATTKSDGVGFTIVTIYNGKIYGDTNIRVYKAEKIASREAKFQQDVPVCTNRAEALQYRSRIAEEKRFYDSLSAKEKKQLSSEYVERLSLYVEWIANCQIVADEGVVLEQSGLVISGDELETENNVIFSLSVEKTEKWTASTDGVHTEQDQQYHDLHDAAQHKEVLQYYEITLSKTVGDTTVSITDVNEDTQSSGKFRITLPIPEVFRGEYKHYSVLHIHNGETVALTDLDDDPNTITIEVDRFSTFVLVATNQEESVTPVATAVTVYSKPGKIEYCVGENLNTTGLVLRVTYSDETVEWISKGFETSGLDSTALGTKTVTVTYEGVSATFTVEVIPSGNCGENISWQLNGQGVLTIQGNGDMTNYVAGQAPWYAERDEIRVVKVLTGVTSVGSYAFAGCHNISFVTLPECLELVGDYAFYDCPTLAEMQIPGRQTQLGEKAVGYLPEAVNQAFALTAYEDSPAHVYAVNNGLSVTVLPSAVVIVGEQKFNTLQSAIDAVDADTELQLLQNVVENVQVDKNIYLDLNGYSINGNVTVAEGYTLYVKDSQTDDYTVEDGNGYGKITGTVSGVAAQEGYMMITEDEETSFHRLNLDTIGLTLRPSVTGVYYQSQFGGDEVIQRNIVAFGMAMSANKMPDFADKSYTRYDVSEWLTGINANGYSNNLKNGTILKNIMDPNGAYSINKMRAQIKVYSQAYVELADGTRILGNSVCYSLREIVEGTEGFTGVDSRWDTLSETQKSEILTMYNNYSNVMRSWNIPNIKAAAAQ